MIKFLKFAPVALLATMTFSLASCSDDDDEPTTPDTPITETTEPSVGNVFPNGLPSNVNGATFTTNAKGQVTKISSGTESVTFEYGKFTPSRATSTRTFTVLMKYQDTQYPEDGCDFYMEINKQGFVSYAHQVPVVAQEETDEWWFEYNADGQLSRMKRTEGGDDYTISYTNGDITKVVQVDEDKDRDEYTIQYTNNEHKTAVANKGAVMLFDYSFCIDMDEMEIAYFAGLLGKATKNLPMSNTYNGEVEAYHWELNANNLPTKFWTGDNTYDVITFAWK